MEMNDYITEEGKETYFDTEDKFIQQYKDTLLADPTVEEVAQLKADYINSKIFKKTTHAKYLKRHADEYEILAREILNSYFSNYTWGGAFDFDDKNLYIINTICPEIQPSFSMKGITNLDDFTKLVLAAGKKILVEGDLDRKLSDDEFNERLKLAYEYIEKHKE